MNKYLLTGVGALIVGGSALYLSASPSVPEVANKPLQSQEVATESATVETATFSAIPVINSTPLPQPLVYDGSKTGPFIEYTERCTSKKIQIYANEQVRYTDNSLMTYTDAFCVAKKDALSLVKPFEKKGSNEELDREYRETQVSVKQCQESADKYYDWRKSEGERDTIKSECKKTGFPE